MLQHQNYYNNLIYGRNCSRLHSNNISRSLKVINYDSRGIIQENLNITDKNIKEDYHTTYETDYLFGFPKTKSKNLIDNNIYRSMTDLSLISRKQNKVMNSAIDQKAFRTWKIPESVISGNFPVIPTHINTTNNFTKPNEILKTKSAVHVIKSDNPHKQEKVSIKESSVSELLESANLIERRIILKSLFLSDPQILKFSLRQALMPEAEKKIRTWLNTATSEEKTTSINFFKRLLKNENLSTDDKYFIQHILEIIKNEEDYWLIKKPHPQFSTNNGESKLKFLNLQTPESRKHRWMYTSWNHMPPYKDDKAFEFTGSHYCLPNKSIPSTYKIHPDMG